MHTALNILRHTPFWAFLILALVVWRSVGACSDHFVSTRKVVWMPLGMQAWALWRVLASPAQLSVASLAWGACMLISVTMCRRLGYPRGLWLDAAAENVFVPGSRLIPLMMLAMYALHFSGEVLTVMRPALAQQPSTVIAFSLAYGMIGGLFMARTLAIWQLLANRYLARS